jgi:catechol 2,3-dioxygenase-like lactoylglutathione lyase family enzyme
MRALRYNHVSVGARDLEESARFYSEVFGMEPVATPDFPGASVLWLRFGEQQLHLFLSAEPGVEAQHFALDVDDFETAYRRARERGILEHETFGGAVRELSDGSVQLYLRDPAGNCIEVNWPDVTTLDRSVFDPAMQRLEDQRPQTGEAARARLYVNR